MKRSTLLLLATLAFPSISALCGDIGEAVPRTPSPDSAEAWNVVVTNEFTLPIKASRAAFSHDSTRMAYFYTEEGNQSQNASGDVFLVIRPLSNWNNIWQIRLPLASPVTGPEADYRKSIVWSQDDKKVALGPFEFQGGTNVLFVELDSHKIIGVHFDSQFSSLLSWTDPTTIYVGSGDSRYARKLNLDTLSGSDLISGIIGSLESQYQLSSNKNYVLENQGSLVVASRNHPYRKILYPHAIQGDMGDEWMVWTPDLHYVMFHAHAMELLPAKLIRLGLRPTPTLDFEIDGLDKSLTPDQKLLLKSAFKDGTRVWATIYAARTNPLTDKVVGPDDAKYIGQGFLTQIEPTFTFRYSFESLPAEPGQIVSGIQIGNGNNWGTSAWGELVSVGSDTKSP